MERIVTIHSGLFAFGSLFVPALNTKQLSFRFFRGGWLLNFLKKLDDQRLWIHSPQNLRDRVQDVHGHMKVIDKKTNRVLHRMC